MTLTIRRRELIAALGGAAVSWSLAAPAQQAAMPVVGFVYPRSPEEWRDRVVAFHRGLEQTGYIEGMNVSVEYRPGPRRRPRAPRDPIELRSEVFSSPK